MDRIYQPTSANPPYAQQHLYDPPQMQHHMYAPPHMQQQMEWHTGIFECCEAPCNTQCLACCCPCYLYALIVTSPELQNKDGRCSGEAAPACAYCLLDHVLYSVMLAMSNQLSYLPFAGFPLSCVIHCGTRKRIRTLHPGHELQGSCCSDVLLTFCCACCVLIQEYEQVTRHTV